MTMKLGGRAVGRWLVAFAWTGLAAATAQATVITGEATNIGGAVWRYEFALSSFTYGADAGFTIYFPLAIVSALTNGSAAADWDLLLLDPDSPPGADGGFDALSLVASPSLSPFRVDATVAGGNPPPLALRFEIYRLSPSFEILETGFTSDPGGAAVPEPGSAVLAGLGALAAFGAARRRIPANRK